MFNTDNEEELNNFDLTDKEKDDEDPDDEEEDEDDGDGISFEKYVELRTKTDPYGDDKEARNKILTDAGYSIDDWEFYEKVWTVEMMDPQRLSQFSELYARYSKKDS